MFTQYWESGFGITAATFLLLLALFLMNACGVELYGRMGRWLPELCLSRLHLIWELSWQNKVFEALIGLDGGLGFAAILWVRISKMLFPNVPPRQLRWFNPRYADSENDCRMGLQMAQDRVDPWTNPLDDLDQSWW